jgi:hypothetical protein
MGLANYQLHLRRRERDPALFTKQYDNEIMWCVCDREGHLPWINYGITCRYLGEVKSCHQQRNSPRTKCGLYCVETHHAYASSPAVLVANGSRKLTPHRPPIDRVRSVVSATVVMSEWRRHALCLRIAN